MHVQRDIDEILRNGFTNQATLLIRRVLQELLAEIIAKGIWRERGSQDIKTDIAKGPTSHEVREMTKRLPKNHVAMFRNALLQLLLQVPASMLILAHTSDLSLKIFQASTGKPINWRMRT
jgi:hypothetical protein